VGGSIQLIRARRFRRQPDDQDGVYLFVDLGCGDRTLPIWAWPSRPSSSNTSSESSLNGDLNSASGRHLPIKDRNLDAALGRCALFVGKTM